MYRLVGLLLLMLVAGIATPRPAQAASPGIALQVLVRSPGLLLDAPQTAAVTEAELRQILGDAVRDAPFWKCLIVGNVGSDALVVIRIQVDEVSAQVYAVSGELRVQGSAWVAVMPAVTVFGIPRPPDWAGPLLDPLAAEQVKAAAALWLRTELAKQKIAPCKATVTLRGKQRVQTPFGSAETSYSGDASLVLREDGSFEANMAVGLQWLTVLAAESAVLTDTQTGGLLTAPDGGCTWSPFAPSTFNLDLAGSYRAQDGSLVFTRLHSSSPSIDGIMTCRFVAPDPVGEIVWTTRWSDRAVESDVLAMLGGEAALTLADGATLAFPRPPAFQGEYDVSLTLAYGSGAAAGTPPAVGARVAPPCRSLVSVHQV